MRFSCCTWALSGSPHHVLGQLAAVGFRWIDIQPSALRTPADQALARRLGLAVSCIGLSFGVPVGAALDHPEEEARRRALAAMDDALAHAAHLGAETAYVIPGLDAGRAALARFATSIRWLAELAAQRRIRLAIEHFPGRALPTIAGTLDFLHAVDHPNFGLLLDIGHAQMSGESAAQAVADAGPSLSYVHLDDNDGAGDLHWALLDGVLTRENLAAVFAALRATGYQGGVSLELSPALADPLDAIVRSWRVVQQVVSVPE